MADLTATAEPSYSARIVNGSSSDFQYSLNVGELLASEFKV